MNHTCLVKSNLTMRFFSSLNYAQNDSKLCDCMRLDVGFTSIVY